MHRDNRESTIVDHGVGKQRTHSSCRIRNAGHFAQRMGRQNSDALARQVGVCAEGKVHVQLARNLCCLLRWKFLKQQKVRGCGAKLAHDPFLSRRVLMNVVRHEANGPRRSTERSIFGQWR
jgi:hypothetical protein